MLSTNEEFGQECGYRSQIQARSANIQRRVGGAGVMTRMYQQYSSNSTNGLSGLAAIAGVPMRPIHGGTALVAVNETREREKRELSQLNDKFAQYVEKVRFLEAQNRKLQIELEALQKRSGQGSSKIKEMFEIEMSEAKKLIDETNRERTLAEMKARESEKEVTAVRKRYDSIISTRDTDRSHIDRLQHQIAENEAQINLFRRRLTDLEDEAKRYKAETQRLASEIARLQSEIQNETFIKSSLDTEKMTLEDELAMIKQMHEADLIELRSKSTVDVTLDPTRFFQNELAQAIRDIRNEFEASNEHQRSELQSRYTMQYNELVTKYQKAELDPHYSEQQRVKEEKLRTTLLTTRNEVAHMKARNEELNNRISELQVTIKQERVDGDRLIARRATEINELKVKLEKLRAEYEQVTTMKTSLEKEINTYRELLEGSSNREGLKQIVGHVIEEARRLEAERLAGGTVVNAIAYATGGATRQTVHHAAITSSGSGPTLSGLVGLRDASPLRTSGTYPATSTSSSSSYVVRRDFSSSS